jgi:NAD(P)-dependent dehydrogenase (short-subunit alcohol dehydrogenase family)
MTPASNFSFDLTGKRILITGAAGRIGSAARLCAAQGAALVLADICAGIEEKVGRIASTPEVYRFDISQRVLVEEMAEKIRYIDTLVDTADTRARGERCCDRPSEQKHQHRRRRHDQRPL